MPLVKGILGEEDIKENWEKNTRVLWRMLRSLLGQKNFSEDIV